MFQQILVSTVVGFAVLASVWKLMPGRRRLRALLALDGWTAKHPSLGGWRARSLMPRIARAVGSGCGSCAANVGTRPRHPPR